MSRFPARANSFSAHRQRTSLLLSLAAAALLTFATAAHAQYAPPEGGTQVHDTSILKPPPGARVALVEFSDFECPMCGSINPLLVQAVEKYKIPLVRYDFPLPYHAWSFKAAVNARWFDIRSKALGDEYRNKVFANQSSIYGLYALNQFTEEFAASHHIAMPFSVDPQGKLDAEVKADYALGQRMGINHTPTVWVVTSNSKGAPFVEVIDRSKLFQQIDQAIADTTPARSTSASKSAKR